MSANLCQHTHPDGTGRQAPVQTGRSFCFFHDPKQERNRTRAQRNGGFMRGRYIDSEPEPSAFASLNLALIEVHKVDDVIPIIVEHLNLYRQGKITKDDAHVIFKGCNGAVCVFREKRQAEHEARLAAEAAREAQKKDAERQIAGFQAAGCVINSTEPAKPEEPIMIDASTPWDLSQFGGKKPRISCVVPVFTSMRTGKIIDVNEPNPLDPPEHMLREEFRRKPQSPSAPDSTRETAKTTYPREDLYQGTTSVVPKDAEEDQLHAAAGPRGPRPFSHKDGARDFAEEKGGGSATDKTAESEPKDAKPKKDPNNPYSITTLLPDPPRLFESKPRDPCADPPETPPPPKPKPGPRLHPMIEYWGLH